MAQTLVTTCDRCGCVIMGIHSVIETKQSSDRRQVLTKADVCDPCMVAFNECMENPDER